ncbi:DNA sulfur modification protein DndB [Pseudomonas fluorescens]|nr:DNA sulfur modification protein DndB [Pseudomonas fluorescens]MBY9029307.1 DNA sulfur modification protein DndB [Pseudomonas fluorescens]MBY9034475.1 DNA sulfur modification protein DndB [Pseudomonas fluorescens]MBY9040959.1 DNA sulfur modification protein DndB [Pseudomonas fluorescens]MBY9046374.1 DNA sulfur modification protein DndB [Pseudomonas fluorescens]
MTSPFSYTFPAIRGVQAGREFYVSMCPLRLLAKLFVFDNEELMPELRAQRSINRTRVPEIARYILSNTDSYTFSAITASIDGKVGFEPVGTNDTTHFRMGTLTVDMDAKFVVNDGQHRRAAIEQALEERPELGDETIAVVFFHDRGLERCQQMFADLNRHAVKPSPSLSVLYDHRNAAASVAKHLGLTSRVFRNLVESERSSLSKRSRKLFTLSALHFAILEMLSAKDLEDFTWASKRCNEFWEVVGEQIPEWTHVRESRMTAGEVRQDFIHSHAIVLQALGRVGKFVYRTADGRPDLKSALKNLRDIDWSRTNSATWEGRAMIGGRMAKNSQNITLTCNQIKFSLGLGLTPEEQVIEDAFLAARQATS